LKVSLLLFLRSNSPSDEFSPDHEGDDEIPAEGSFQVPPNDELPREINIESFNKLQLSPALVSVRPDLLAVASLVKVTLDYF